MTTKEQERKALAQIKKIVEGLGENSYIGTAFEGCFEIAEENIENDFACSMKERWESAQAEVGTLRKNVTDLAAQVGCQKKTLESVKEDLSNMTDIADDYLSRMQEYQQQANEATQKYTAIESKLEFLEAEKDKEIKQMQEEIIHLKAKLYDLITK